jgi:hypothetical protein
MGRTGSAAKPGGCNSMFSITIGKRSTQDKESSEVKKNEKEEEHNLPMASFGWCDGRDIS